MKKGTKILAICTIIIMTVFLLKIIYTKASPTRNIKIIKSNNGIQEYYKKNKRTIYTYNLKSIKYKNQELNSYSDIFLVLEKIIDKMEYRNTYKDDSSVLYKSNNFNILTCNTYKNNDIYIGESNMTYESDLCKSKEITLTKSYHIIAITHSTNEEYIYLTLQNFETNNEVETIKIKKKLTPNLSIGKTYTFTLQIKEKNIDTLNSQELFDNSNIINVTEEK